MRMILSETGIPPSDRRSAGKLFGSCPDARAGLLVATRHWRPPHSLVPRSTARWRGWRMQAQGERSSLPVICLGNLTVGGSGKRRRRSPSPICCSPRISGRSFSAAATRTARRTNSRQSHAPSCRRCGRRPHLLARLAPTVVAATAPPARNSRNFAAPAYRDGRRLPKSDARQNSRNSRRRWPPRHRKAGSFRQDHCAAPLAFRTRSRPGASRRRTARWRCGGDRTGRPARSRHLPGRLEPDRQVSRRSAGAKCWPRRIGDPERLFATLTEATSTSPSAPLFGSPRYRRRAQSLTARRGLEISCS